MPQKALRGRWAVQVAAETSETTHTWRRWMPQRALRGRWKGLVAAEMPKTAHTWRRQVSLMSPRRFCDGDLTEIGENATNDTWQYLRYNSISMDKMCS